MSNKNRAEFGTRRLDNNAVQSVPMASDQSDSGEYPVPWVIALRVVGTPTVIQVHVGRELVIGRSDPRHSSKPDIDLELYDGYQQGVSRRHALIYPKNNRLVIRDLGSANGTYINERWLQEGQEYKLRHGDHLVIGKLELQVFFDVMPTSKDLPDKTDPVRFQIPILGSGQHILLVDQDTDVAYVLGSVLEQAGFKITVVGNFASAMSFIDQQMPDILITELMLPDMSGLDLMKYIRDRQTSRVPLLVITSASGGYQMGQAVDMGVDVFMSKPVGIDELLRSVTKVLGQTQA